MLTALHLHLSWESNVQQKKVESTVLCILLVYYTVHVTILTGSDSEVKSKLDKSDKPKKTVCFASTSDSVGSSEKAGTTSAGDKEENDETDSELTQPHEQEEAKEEEKKDETGGAVPSLKRNATSMMDVDQPSDAGTADATVAYEMETDTESNDGEENKKEEEESKEKEEDKVKEKSPTDNDVEPTVAYALEDLKQDDDDDSDKTDIEDNEETKSDDKTQDDSKATDSEEKKLPSADQQTEKSDKKENSEDIPTIVCEPTVPYIIAERDKEDATGSDDEPKSKGKGWKIIVYTTNIHIILSCMQNLNFKSLKLKRNFPH